MLWFVILCFCGVCVYVSCGDYFGLFTVCLFFFPKEREKEGKGMELHGKGVEKNLEAVLGGETVIRIYCMKKLL